MQQKIAMMYKFLMSIDKKQDLNIFYVFWGYMLIWCQYSTDIGIAEQFTPLSGIGFAEQFTPLSGIGFAEQ